MIFTLKKLMIITTIVVNGIYANAQTAGGFVFSDINKNKMMDKGEKGIPGVAVSNGIDVVLTDRKGSYSIAAPDNSVIFVIKPSGFDLPVDENNVSRFYYLNFPNGSPKLHFKGVSPTGPLPKNINFPLTPVNETDTFKALFFGDTQLRTIQDIDYLNRDVIAELLGPNEYAFVSVLGDIVDSDFSLYPDLKNAMTMMHMPVYYVQGNHDINWDATSDRLASETYTAYFGPKNYAYNYGKVHFVVLDDIIYSGDTIKRSAVEGFDDDAITFLKNDLAHVDTGKLVVLMMHAPFLNIFENKVPMLNLDKALAILSRYPHTFSMSAHSHTMTHQLLTNQYGWTRSRPHHHFNAGAVCGDWWKGKLDDLGLPEATMRDGTPNGYAIINFRKNSYTIDYKVARSPNSYQMNIYATKVRKDSTERWTNTQLFVNFFIGSEKDTVKFRIDNGKWMIMQHTVEPDPYYYDNLNIWKSGASWPGNKPSDWGLNSSHLWKTNLPSGLSSGLHRVEVEATDLFGQKYKAFQVIWIQ